VLGDIPHAFLSDMHQKQHHNLNMVLNELVQNPPNPRDRIRYKRIKQKDSFYHENGRKIRVSSVADTGEIKEVIMKEKVDHLDIYCPNSQLDMRISVNTETPCTPSLSHSIYEY
jgi:polynucleotide 5'-triphosphatase